MDSLSSSGDGKTALMQQVRQEAAIANARALVDKLNEHCFERCVPTPGSSLSSGEKTCFSACLEKYMGAWNVVSRQYVQRLQQQQQQRGAGGLQ